MTLLRFHRANVQIRSPCDPLVSKHASFPLDTWNLTAGGSSSLTTGSGPSVPTLPFSSSESDDEDDDDDDDDDDDEDVRFAFLFDSLSSPSFSCSCSLLSLSDSAVKLL
mgnify:CR=1 FL=1